MDKKEVKIERIEIDNSNRGFFGAIWFSFYSEKQFTRETHYVEGEQYKSADTCLTALKKQIRHFVENYRSREFQTERLENVWL